MPTKKLTADEYGKRLAQYTKPRWWRALPFLAAREEKGRHNNGKKVVQKAARQGIAPHEMLPHTAARLKKMGYDDHKIGHCFNEEFAAMGVTQEHVFEALRATNVMRPERHLLLAAASVYPPPQLGGGYWTPSEPRDMRATPLALVPASNTSPRGDLPQGVSGWLPPVTTSTAPPVPASVPPALSQAESSPGASTASRHRSWSGLIEEHTQLEAQLRMQNETLTVQHQALAPNSSRRVTFAPLPTEAFRYSSASPTSNYPIQAGPATHTYGGHTPHREGR